MELTVGTEAYILRCASNECVRPAIASRQLEDRLAACWLTLRAYGMTRANSARSVATLYR